MNDRAPQVPPPQVPPVEQPQTSADDALEKLEENTLDKEARSAAFRAVVEHDKHLRALNVRIEVLQAKLDKREEELHRTIPRVAELEQAEKTAKVDSVVETMGAGGGAILLGTASFMPESWLKFCLIGAGISASAIGVFAKVLFTLFGWPKDRLRDST